MSLNFCVLHLVFDFGRFLCGCSIQNSSDLASIVYRDLLIKLPRKKFTAIILQLRILALFESNWTNGRPTRYKTKRFLFFYFFLFTNFMCQPFGLKFKMNDINGTRWMIYESQNKHKKAAKLKRKLNVSTFPYNKQIMLHFLFNFLTAWLLNKLLWTYVYS